mgnify:CR=1 FL=1
MKKKAAWIPWLTGLCMSTALMAAIFLFGDLKYAMNDDTAILRQYMGFGTGEIPEAHAFLHPLLSTPLRWLGLAAPEVAWFSWMQLALLWLAGAVSVKALMQCFAHRGRSPWLGAAAGAVYLTLFGMTAGTAVTVMNYISQIFSPLESLGMEIQTIQSAMAGVKRIDAFLAQPERTIPAERRTAARGDVELAHVTFGYGEKPVLSDFSMTVKQGGQVTLVGRTGAGKSTVFKLLLGLYQPQAGTVTIGGVDVARITDRERRTCIGCVEQHFSRVPGTVLEQITLGDPQITAEMARNAAKLAGIDEAIQALPEGCDTICSDGMFSQGEWQLLSIARAAAADPAVLLLDEVTANLDAETEARVLEALRRASAGRTVLSVSHRIYENLGGRTVKIEPQSM